MAQTQALAALERERVSYLLLEYELDTRAVCKRAPMPADAQR